jgi:hypothetical protein
MRAEFLTIGILILDNLTLDFPMPVKYACRILNYWSGFEKSSVGL